MDYEINSETLAIIPITNQTSRVFEPSQNFVVEKNSNDIIKSSCHYFGSSYKGRLEGSKSLLGTHYKAPIIVEETKEIIFFPTKSARYNVSPWISLKKIDKYYKMENNSVIEFDDGTKIEFDLSYGSLENQIMRASRLQSILQKRKNL